MWLGADTEGGVFSTTRIPPSGIVIFEIELGKVVLGRIMTLQRCSALNLLNP